MDASLSSRLGQLNQAKALVETDPTYFPQIVVGVLPVFVDPEVELRRWVAEFVMLAFSSTNLDHRQKQDLAIKSIERLSHATIVETDIVALKCFIQTSTTVYPLLFQYITSNYDAGSIWKQLSALKSSILAKWESPHAGLRICCLKFAQRIITVQSRASKDPRLVMKEDISLSLLAANHPHLNERELSAESDALVDRMCSILTEDPFDPIFMCACVSCLCVLVKTRVALSTKIISSLLNCDPTRLEQKDNTALGKYQAKTVEKSVKLALVHLLKNNSAGPLGNRIQQHLVGRARRVEDDSTKKRQAPDVTDASNKRLRTEMDGGGTPTPSVLSVPPLPEGPVPLSTIFNLANDNALSAFDVTQLPQELVVQIILATIGAIQPDHLQSSIETTSARYKAIESRSVPLPQEPQAGFNVSEVLASKRKSPETAQLVVIPPPVTSALQVELPEPPDLTHTLIGTLVSEHSTRLFSSVSVVRKPLAASLTRRSGLTKVIGSLWDKESWTAILTRLATRLGDISIDPKTSEMAFTSADIVREQIFFYVTSSFRERLEFCTSWLSEEWYTESLLQPADGNASHYHHWTSRILDAILPYIESRDRLFMRFMSDLPDLSYSIIRKLKTLCVDPDRAQLGYTTLQYLIMLRPPVRNICLDLVEELQNEDSSEMAQQQKILSRWRPGIVSKD